MPLMNHGNSLLCSANLPINNQYLLIIFTDNLQYAKTYCEFRTAFTWFVTKLRLTLQRARAAYLICYVRQPLFAFT